MRYTCLWTEHLTHLINWKKLCTFRQCATLGIKRHKTWQSFTVRFLLFLHFWQSRGIFAPMWSRSRNNPGKETQIKHLDSILWIIQMYFRCTCAKYLNYLVFLLYLLHCSEKNLCKKEENLKDSLIYWSIMILNPNWFTKRITLTQRDGSRRSQDWQRGSGHSPCAHPWQSRNQTRRIFF